MKILASSGFAASLPVPKFPYSRFSYFEKYPLARIGGKGYNIQTFLKQQKEEIEMKKDIHPAYGEATIVCACGNVIKTASTKKEMQVNTCSSCHPYYTGQKTMVDTEGRVDSFKKRYAKFAK